MVRRALSKRPSASMVVALTALFVALGGSAVAATLISGSRLKNRSVSGAKIKKDAIGGTEIKESKVGKVPKATRADSAKNADNANNANTVGGASIQKVFRTSVNGTAATPLFSANGLTVSFGCVASKVVLTAQTSVDNAAILSAGNTGSSAATTATTVGGSSSNFDTGDTFDIIQAKSRGVATLTYARADGKTVTFTFGSDNPTTFGGISACFVSGTVVS